MSQRERSLFRPEGRQSNNLIVWIIFIIIIILIIWAIIWIWKTSDKATNPPTPTPPLPPACNFIELEPVTCLECCKKSCPQHTWTISWKAVSHADCYMITIDWFDHANQSSGQGHDEANGISALFHLDPKEHSDQISLTITVVARSKACGLLSAETILEKPFISGVNNSCLLNQLGAPGSFNVPANQPGLEIPWFNEHSDPSNMFDSNVNPTQVIINTNGMYHLEVGMILLVTQPANTSFFGARIRVNGVNVAGTTYDKDPPGGISRGFVASVNRILSAGDVVTVFVQGAGAPIAVNNVESTHFDVVLLSQN